MFRDHRRIYPSPNRFFDVVTLRLPVGALHFVDIEASDPRAKLGDLAHFRQFKARARGESRPEIVVFGLLEHDRPAGDLFPHLDPITEQGERLVSGNSSITYAMRTLAERGWLHYRRGKWQLAVPETNPKWRAWGQAVLDTLTRENRLWLETDHSPPQDTDLNGINVRQNLIPAGKGGFLSDVVRRKRPRLAFNTSFFLLEDEDFVSHHSALGDGYNLWVADGIIQRPPLYRRGAIWYDTSWHVGRLGLEDVQIILPGGQRLYPAGSDVPHNSVSSGALPFTVNQQSAVTAYTRYHGAVQGAAITGYTPPAKGSLELTVVDRRVVGWKRDGGLLIPQNGFVLSFAPGSLAPGQRHAFQDALRTDFRVSYVFCHPQHHGIRRAIQAGPLLLVDGQRTLVDENWHAQEQFWPSRALPDGRWQIGVVPTDYKFDIDRTRAGRAGLGIDAQGELILVVVAGVNSGMGIEGVDSDGATLNELIELLRDAGAIHAVNLDGGGSTQAYYHGGQIIVPGDRRGQPWVRYERIIPSIGIVP